MTPLSQVEPRWADKAKAVLYPFRWRQPESPHDGEINVSRQRADRLEQAICEALADAYEAGAEAMR